jgi:hypothetical protein
VTNIRFPSLLAECKLGPDYSPDQRKKVRSASTIRRSATEARICCFLLGVAMACGLSGVAQAPQQPQAGGWWRLQAPGMWLYRNNAKKLPLISVKGNKFVDPGGNVMMFRGLSISDPDELASQGHWSRDLFVKVQEMGAKVVRIPVHSVAGRGRTPAEYLKLLDQAVAWCTDLNLYIMLD